MADGQNDFYTLQSLATFAGSAGATAVISNVIQQLVNVNPRWLALAVAEVICLATVYFTHAAASGQPLSSDYFLAVVNGFLVYSTAAGSTSIGNTIAHGAPAGGSREAGLARGNEGVSGDYQPQTRGFFTPWF